MTDLFEICSDLNEKQVMNYKNAQNIQIDYVTVGVCFITVISKHHNRMESAFDFDGMIAFELV